MTRNSDELDFGFIILSPEHNIGRIQSTARSIRNNYGSETPIVCVVDKGTTKSELNEIEAVCPVYKGKNTITSLINTGLKKGHPAWNIIVMEGTWVPIRLNYKFQKWIKSTHDVLFPIVCDRDRDGIPRKIYKEFHESTLNGLCMHQKTFKEVGDFTDNPLEISRTFWFFEAVSKGVKFKAILGIKVI